MNKTIIYTRTVVQSKSIYKQRKQANRNIDNQSVVGFIKASAYSKHNSNSNCYNFFTLLFTLCLTIYSMGLKQTALLAIVINIYFDLQLLPEVQFASNSRIYWQNEQIRRIYSTFNHNRLNLT